MARNSNFHRCLVTLRIRIKTKPAMVKVRKSKCKNWQIRNDSANVAAAVNPKMHMHCHRNCYCNEKNVPPRLFSRPKQCVYVEDDFFDRFAVKKAPPFCYKDVEWCRKFRDVDTDSEDFDSVRKFVRRKKKTKEAVASRASSLDDDSFQDRYYTRTDFSTSKEDQTEETQRKTSDASLTTKTGTRTKSSSSKEYQPEPGRTKSSSSKEYQPDARRTESSTSIEDQKEDQERSKPETSALKEMIDFRNDHYFETHSTEDLFKTIPEHICVHKFGLDDRLFPQPLNPDAYEVSRCIICGKPMTNLPVTKIDERVSASKKNIFPKFYKYGLAPRKIYMANDRDVRVEMALDGWVSDKFKCTDLERPNYFNTFALKYQKGVA